MYLKLKENETFINPETDETHAVLTGGIKNINIDVDGKRCNFLVKFFEEREKMEAGKRPEFQQSFSIEDTKEGKTDFTQMYTSNPNLGMFGVNMETLMYDFIISQDEFNMFEKVN